MDSQTSATTSPDDAPSQGPSSTAAPTAADAPAAAPTGGEQSVPADGEPTPPAGAEAPQAGFGSRGRLRRRARFLRKARELAYRDLGGLVFSLHRFGQRNDSLVLAKLSTLGRIDAELRAIEHSLSERQPLTVLREAGITACPRCAAIHSSEDRFCPSCGLPLSRRSDLPIAGAPPGGGAPQASTPAATQAPAPSVPDGTPAVGSSGAHPAPTPASPATAQQPVAAPSPSDRGTSPQSAPAPATQAFDAVRPVDGGGQAPASAKDDQPTEIIRPPASGS